MKSKYINRIIRKPWKINTRKYNNIWNTIYIENLYNPNDNLGLTIIIVKFQYSDKLALWFVRSPKF